VIPYAGQLCIRGIDVWVIKRINEGSRPISVVLDGLDPVYEVPVSVRHLLFESVDDTEKLRRRSRPSGS